MDFHSFTRKELQTLCKKNKIPANITNVAMADALKALETVEGLDEFMNQSQSPEKIINKSSQEIPSTVARTSTRRKTNIEEPQSIQPTTRTRRTTRKTMELNEENKNVNVPDTPVTTTTTRRKAQKTKPEVEEQKKSEQIETPALQSGRQRTGVGSTRRKVEVQREEGMQPSCGTRRSVRLLEKCMAGLSLKGTERMETLKIDETVEDAVGNGKNGQSGTISEVPLARNLSASLEDESDLKDDTPGNNKCNNGETDCTVIAEADSDKSGDLDCLSAVDTKDSFPNGKTDEPEGEDTLADIPNEIIDPKGSHDVAVSEDLNEELAADNNGGSHADETKSIEVLAADTFEDISEKVLDHSSFAQEIECQKLVDNCDINALHDGLPVAEGDDEGKVFPCVSVLPNGHMGSSEKLGNEESDGERDDIVPESNTVDAFLGDSDIDDDDTGCDKCSLADEQQEEVSCEQNSICIPTAAYSSEDPMTNVVDEAALIEVNVTDAETIHVSSFHNAPQSVVDDDIPVPKMLDYGDEEALVDVCVKPAEEFADNTAMEILPQDEAALIEVNVTDAETIHVSSFHNAPQSVVDDDIPVPKMLDYGDEEALVDVCVKPAEEFADNTAMEILPEEKTPTATKLMSGITTSIQLSPLTTAQFSQPTRFTPRKSSTKKQTTIPKVTQVSDNNNKENVDNSSAKEVTEPGLGKMKKNKNIIDKETMQKLESMSLRNLKKLNRMFEKLQITDNMKNKEDKIDSKQALGEARPALQTLPQNCMRTGELGEARPALQTLPQNCMRTGELDKQN